MIVRAKIFLQEIWQQKLDWDHPLDHDMQVNWTRFRTQLANLTGITIPRHVIIKNHVNIELHAFSDASERAYGTTIYLRSWDARGNTEVHLLCSKSRVAPVSQVSLPRLELCGAVIMVELVKKVTNIMDIKFSKITYWTDSEIVLSWIYNDVSYKTFVANRVSSIRRNTQLQVRRYEE